MSTDNPTLPHDPHDAGDDGYDEEPCGENSCVCRCTFVHDGAPCGCDCPHDDGDDEDMFGEQWGQEYDDEETDQ